MNASRWTTLVLVSLGVVLVVEAVSIVAGGLVDSILVYAPGIDKVLHVLAFLSIYLVCNSLTRNALPDLRVRSMVLCAGLFLLAAGDELGQSLRPGRSLDWDDFAASLSGVALGAASRWRPVGVRVAVAMALAALAVAGSVTFDSFQTQRHINTGVLFSRAGDFSSARREYRQAYEAGIRSATLLNELGWVEIESGEGDPQVAVEFAAEALGLQPDNPDIHDTYGWALHHAGRSAEALPHLERAYAEKPDMFCIHYHLGQVFLALGRPEEARFHLLRQVERRDTREAARAADTLAQIDPSRG